MCFDECVQRLFTHSERHGGRGGGDVGATGDVSEQAALTHHLTLAELQGSQPRDGDLDGALAQDVERIGGVSGVEEALPARGLDQVGSGEETAERSGRDLCEERHRGQERELGGGRPARSLVEVQEDHLVEVDRHRGWADLQLELAEVELDGFFLLDVEEPDLVALGVCVRAQRRSGLLHRAAGGRGTSRFAVQATGGLWVDPLEDFGPVRIERDHQLGQGGGARDEPERSVGVDRALEGGNGLRRLTAPTEKVASSVRPARFGGLEGLELVVELQRATRVVLP